MKYILLFLLSLIIANAWAQSERQMDTTFYSSDKRYEFIYPKINIGETATNKVTKIDVKILNGDTTKLEQSENIFSYSVNGKNDTDYYIEFVIDDKKWETILFEKGMPEKKMGTSRCAANYFSNK